MVAMLSLLLAIPLMGQGRTKTHDLGDYKLRVSVRDGLNTNSNEPTGEWPQDHYRYANVVFYQAGHTILKWVDSLDVEHVKENRFYPSSYSELEPYGIFEYRRYEPPEVWVYTEGELLLSSRRYEGEIDPDLISDQMIEVHYKSKPGFDVVKRSYSYSNPNHDDYVIHVNRYVVTFDWDDDDEVDTYSDQTIEGVYFFIGYAHMCAEGSRLTGQRWYEEGKDDWATFETFPSVLVPAARDLVVSYGWDGDHPTVEAFEDGGILFDDTGDPRYRTGGRSAMPSGEFVSNAYAGWALLHADTSPTDRTDDITQPVAIVTNITVYDMWDEDFGYATIWDWAFSGNRQDVTEQAGWPDDAGQLEGEYPFQAYGPYDLALGDTVTIVYALGANGISRSLAISKGLEWRDWYRGVAGANFDDDAKNELLATGKDSLFQTMDRALWTWSRGLDIPDPPPSPDLEVTSGPNRITLDWEDLSSVGDADTDVNDLAGYNIYRKQGEFLVDTYNELYASGVHHLWELIDNVGPGVTSYEDTNVTRGEAYHYAVTAFDDGTQNADGLFPGQPMEGSKYANRSEIPAYAFEPGLDNADSVRVVPNPYILKAGKYNFTGADDRLLIVNLPAFCTLRIYTVTGDLIKEIEHTSGSADESWDQVTESNQMVASGVYILQVADGVDLDGNEVPDSIEKFVIVR